MIKLLDQLNDKQKEAVLQTEGPVLILAGAGSGKTRALTFRVSYLIKEKKISPKNVLAVTFTNKAAGEMMDRVKELLGLPYSTTLFSQYLPNVGTFHSICVRILRKEIEKMGYKKNFVIYDDQDQLAVMKRVMKDLEISKDQIKPKAILGAMSDAKNKLVDARQFEEQIGSFFEEQVSKCFLRYARELKAVDALDFDDIIMLTVKIFQKYPDILKKYQKLFRYIMVDEYQDTNHAQYILLKLLAEQHKNICVVGDDWQSIYGWRGADVQNILDFEKDYPDAKIVLLEQNYRSTQNILDAAHQVISKNVNRKDKKLWTQNDKGNLLTLFEAHDEKDEARFVIEQIEQLKKEHNLGFDDFAVLYRTNAQSRALEEAFLKADIPYKIVGGVKFYQRKEVKDVLAYLYFTQNPLDRANFERIVNVPARGIGAKTIEKVLRVAIEKKLEILDAIELLCDEEKGAEFGLAKSKKKVLSQFQELIQSLSSAVFELTVSNLVEKVYRDSGYEAMLAKGGEEGLIRHENVKELLTVAKKYDDQADGVLSFLEEVALVSQADSDLSQKEMVPLMTLHSAKGLEYKMIFIVGMEEGLLPHSRAVLNEREMEEERRLCYVGITRAKQKVHLIYTNTRSIYGSTQISVKSRFVDEIDNELFEEKYSEVTESVFFDDFGSNDKYRGKKGFIKKTVDFEFGTIDVNADTKEEKTKHETDFRDGDSVEHPEFGRGIVVSQEDSSVNVAFRKIGVKKLAKGIAPLKKL
ncbi:MAG: UvrD-helicase domain-containing protein [Patescibacteria group bacterium]|nr:UvrD-helicase domain-containing protein [Patescibacteria group bacterium]